MATTTVIPSQAFMAAFLPVARASLFPSITQPITRRILPLQRLRSSSILPAALLPIPSIIDTIWEGILKAVPKKKTSHMKKRHRFMAGKALKDVTSLNKCSSCGRLKRAHVLCPYCVTSIKRWFSRLLRPDTNSDEQMDSLPEAAKTKSAKRSPTKERQSRSEEPLTRAEAKEAAQADRFLQQLVKQQAALEEQEAKQEQVSPPHQGTSI